MLAQSVKGKQHELIALPVVIHKNANLSFARARKINNYFEIITVKILNFIISIFSFIVEIVTEIGILGKLVSHDFFVKFIGLLLSDLGSN